MRRNAARHPDHHPGVALPDDHLAGARDPRRRRGRDRRRDPRRRPVQARLAPGADPGAARRTRQGRGRRRSSGSGSRPPSGRWSGSRSSWSGPKRECEIVDAGRKELDLEIVVPVEDMTEPGAPGDRTRAPRTTRPARADARPGGQPRSIWPAIYPELLKLVREHTSTIIFVNNRRGAERLAKRLNELAQRGGPRRSFRQQSTRATDSPRPGRLRASRAAAATPSRSPAPTTARSPTRSGRRRGAAEVRASSPASSPPRRSSSASTWARSTS